MDEDGGDVTKVARRWAGVWEQAWPRRDVDAVVALYADDARYRALAFRDPDRGHLGVRDYLTRTFSEEEAVECRFGEPVVDGDRAVVEWWASWREGDEEVTMAGATILRFGPGGLVVDHRDYWNQAAGRHPPYDGW